MSWVLAIALALSTAADIHTTDACQRRGCIETDWAFNRHPSAARVIATETASSALLIGALEVTRKHKWLKWAMRGVVAGMAAGHAYYAYGNAGTCQRGCRSGFR